MYNDHLLIQTLSMVMIMFNDYLITEYTEVGLSRKLLFIVQYFAL